MAGCFFLPSGTILALEDGEQIALIALVALEVHEGAHSLETGPLVDQPMVR